MSSNTPFLSGEDRTINSHFFSEFGQRLIRVCNQLGPFGRLYEVDARLRPTGKSGSLAVSFDAFDRYFTDGPAQLWERQALCKARPVYGSEEARRHAMEIVARAAFSTPWRPEFATEIREMRMRMEENASKRNLKRGPGGTVDTEFLVQMLQLKHGGEDPSIRVPGTLDALTALEKAGYLSFDDAEYFRGSYPLPTQHRSPHPPDGRRRPARAARNGPRAGQARVPARLLAAAGARRRGSAQVC